jgi:hypothetical protein
MIGRLDTTRDIVNGAVVNGSTGTLASNTYDNRQRTHHLPSGEVASLQQAYGRYLSGEWTTEPLAQVAGDNNSSTIAGSGAVVYYSATPNRTHILGGVAFGFTGTPTSGYVRIESPSGTNIFGPVKVANSDNYSFGEDGLRCSRGNDVLVHVVDEASGVKASVGVWGHRYG